MRFYEEYENKTEKRRAQNSSRPLRRKYPTGKARGYLLVFDEDGFSSSSSYTYGALGSILSLFPGDKPYGGVSSASPSVDYLRENCRIVGANYLPPEWKQCFADSLEGYIEQDAIPIEDVPRYRRAINKLRRSNYARRNRKAVV